MGLPNTSNSGHFGAVPARLPGSPYYLGNWRVDPETLRLRKGGRIVKIEPKAMEVLCCLVAAKGRVVTRQAILDTVWNGNAVVYQALSRVIALLRHALGDDAGNPKYIETVSKAGYRIVAPINPPTSERWRAFVERIPAIKSRYRLFGAAMAIVFSIGAAMEYYASLGSGDNSSAASPPPAITMDNASAAWLANRGRELYLEYKKDSNEAAIDLYRKAIERDPTSPYPYAGLAGAFAQRWLRWQEPITNLEGAIEAANTAIRLMPDNAMGYKALGAIYNAAGIVLDDPAQYFPLAEDAYKIAVQLEGPGTGAYYNLGNLYFRLARYEEAADLFYQVYNSGWARAWAAWRLGEIALLAGETERARAWYLRSIEADPAEPKASARLAQIQIFQGQPEAAIEFCDKLIARYSNMSRCANVAGDAAYLLGRYDLADAYFDRSIALEHQFQGKCAEIICLHARARKLEVRLLKTGAEEDRRALQEFAGSHTSFTYLERATGEWHRSVMYALLGDDQAAIRALAAARAEGWVEPAWDNIEPAFAGLHGTDEFRAHLVATRIQPPTN